MTKQVHTEGVAPRRRSSMGRLVARFVCGGKAPAHSLSAAPGDAPNVPATPTIQAKVPVDAPGTPTALATPPARPDSPPVPALLARPRSPPVPALLHGGNPESPALAVPAIVAAADADTVPTVPLSPAAAAAGEPGEEGEPAWARRRDAMQQLLKDAKQGRGDAGVMMAAVREALDDKVGPVYFAAFDAFRAIVKAFPGACDPAPALPALLLKMADRSKRTEREAGKCIMRVARTPAAGGPGALAPYLGNAELPLRPRLLLLRLVLREFKGGLPLPLVMGVAVPALQIADDKTRKAAVAVIVAAYAVAGDRVQQHLSSVKPVLIKILHRKFAELAGEQADGGAGGGSGAAPRKGGRPGRPNTVPTMPSMPSRAAGAYLPSLGNRVGTAPASAAVFGCDLDEADSIFSSLS